MDEENEHMDTIFWKTIMAWEVSHTPYHATMYFFLLLK
jgi:hypothetical protein